LTSSQIEEIENHPKNLRKSASSAVKKVLKNQRFELAVRYAIGTILFFCAHLWRAVTIKIPNSEFLIPNLTSHATSLSLPSPSVL
jgi:hypothetical protein